MIKNKLRLIATVAVILLTSANLSTFAQRTTNIEVVPYVKKKVWFNASGLDQSQQFQVKIQTEQGDLLYSETFKNKAQYKKVLDFSFAKEGNYYVDLINDKGLLRKVINISEDALVDNSFKFSTGETTVLTSQFRKVDEDKVALTLQSSLSSPVSLKIIDGKGNVLHQENDIDESNIGKLINMSKLEDGFYSVALTSKNYTSYYSVNLGK